jgi:hypothetical protein
VVRLVWIYAATISALATAAAVVALCAPVRSPGAQSARFQPFAQFVQGLESARPSAYLGRPGSAVASTAEFERMRRHLLRLYRGVTVTRSFVLDGQVFDCVPVDRQPGVVLQGVNRLAAPPPNPPARGAPGQDADERAGAAGGEQDCAAGRVPMRRVTLAEVTRFATLRDFLSKAPTGRAPVAPTTKKGP